MKKAFIGMAIAALTACNVQQENPLLNNSSLPYGAPEFSKYESTHYESAFMEAFKQQKAEIDAIVANTEEPTFDNTIGALERSGRLLSKVVGVFFNLNETDADEAMEKVVEMSVARGWRLKEIHLERSSLDAIFSELSKKA